jgi:hypothetical protein
MATVIVTCSAKKIATWIRCEACVLRSGRPIWLLDRGPAEQILEASKRISAANSASYRPPAVFQTSRYAANRLFGYLQRPFAGRFDAEKPSRAAPPSGVGLPVNELT